ncbi:SDR family NAD(P)-dependent oxidoreductase [Nesterenkonia suensis]
MTTPTRRALITGGGTGIGAATARLLADRGWRVAVTGRRPEPLREVADEVGGVAFPADLSAAESAQAAVDAAAERLGGLDALIANAGGHGFATAEETSTEAWEASMGANVGTAFHTARAALCHLRRSRGSIVMVSSLAGLRAGPGVVGYTTGKHAVIGLTRALARDHGKEGIRVNAICPGWTRTPMADEEMDQLCDAVAELPDRESAYAHVSRHVPLGRPADAAEVAQAIAFLSGPESACITGATLVADGGAHIVDVPTLAFDALS